MRMHWIFRRRCGCPFGVMDQQKDTPTEHRAWVEFYDDADDERAAVQRGVTVELVDRDTYRRDVYPKMLLAYTCPHGGAS